MAKCILVGQDSTAINDRLTSHTNDMTQHMTEVDKTKLNGVETGATKTVVVNNLTTSTVGSALDAAQGKILREMIAALQTVEFYVDIEGEGAEGITVTATCGSTVESGTTDSNGKCVLRSSVLGTYNITYSTQLMEATNKVVANSYGFYCISAMMPPTDVGYLMLYDQGDECEAITGGWKRCFSRETNYPAIFTKNADNLYMESIAESGSETGNNPSGLSHDIPVNTTDYAAVVFDYKRINIPISGMAQAFVEMAAASKIPDGTSPFPITDHYIADKQHTVRRQQKIDISDIDDDRYMAVSTWKFGSTGGNVRSAVNLYHVFLLKADDWQTWLSKAGLNPSSYANLDAVLSNASAMAVLGNSTAAIRYMLHNTGTIMGGVLASDTAFQALSTAAKQKMADNPHWVKFAAIYGRIV